MSADLPSVLERLATLRTYLGAAEAVLKEGAMPEMQDLDHRINDLCRDIEQVEGEGRGDCLKELQAVLASLDTCRAGLLNWRKANAHG